MKGFLLGLTNGTTCMAYCMPVLIPYMLGEAKNTKNNFKSLAKFLLGRFIGYIIFALLAWILNKIIFHNSLWNEVIIGLAYIILSTLMLIYGISNPHKLCTANSLKGIINKFTFVKSPYLPIVLGLVTGLNFCPPFLLAFTEATIINNLLQSIFFFSMFFLATSLYFIPAPFLGFFNGYKELKIIGKMVAVIISLYYLFSGIMILVGVLHL